MSRYLRRTTGVNDYEQYDDILEKRGVSKIEQYRTPRFKFFDEDDIRSIDHFDYVWRNGDAFWRLAKKYLNGSENWWVIAAMNKKPTEAHIEVGEVIKIPTSLAQALQVVG
jgi:nucleoid-associated protein YgaU